MKKEKFIKKNGTRKVSQKVSFSCDTFAEKVSFCQGILPKTSKTENEILHLLNNEHLTIRQIALRRQKSIRSIQRNIKSLKEKGFLNPKNGKCRIPRPTSDTFPQKVSFSVTTPKLRLHAQEFHINILFKDEAYKQILKKGNLLNIDGNTVRLYNDAIEVYSGKSFIGDSVDGVTAESFGYWNNLFVRLENDLKVILVKPRSVNVRLVNSHYAEVGNELAKSCYDSGEKVRVFTRDDGKLWFVIDNSFNLHEAETLHPVSSQKDMRDVVRPFFNDLREGKAPMPSEVWMLLAEVIKHEEALTINVRSMAEILKLLLPKKEDLTENFKDKPEYLG